MLIITKQYLISSQICSSIFFLHFFSFLTFKDPYKIKPITTSTELKILNSSRKQARNVKLPPSRADSTNFQARCCNDVDIKIGDRDSYIEHVVHGVIVSRGEGAKHHKCCFEREKLYDHETCMERQCNESALYFQRAAQY